MSHRYTGPEGAIVEWVEHPVTKRRAPIRLDKGRMTFYARENDNDVTSEPFSTGTAGAFKLPSFAEGSSRDKVIFAYTPDVWKALLLLIRQIKEMRKTLGELVGTKQGVAVLAEIGTGKATLALAPGPKAKA